MILNKKKLVVCTLFLGTFLFSTTVFSKAISTDYLDNLYREGYQYEQLRLYPEARKKYLDVSTLFFKSYDKYKDKSILLDRIPVLISSGFRLSIATAKDNYHNMYQLVHQLETFHEAHQVIERILDVVIELRASEEARVSRGLYEDLFFSRAYNRIAWANKLLIAIPWKNYIVFPPSDILGMINLAMEDLEQYLFFQGFNLNKAGLKRVSLFEKARQNRFKNYHHYYQNLFENMDAKSLVFRTKELMNFQSNKEILSTINAKRSYHQAYKLLHVYHSKRSQQIIQKSKQHYTLEAILHKKNKPLFSLLDSMIHKLDIPL